MQAATLDRLMLATSDLVTDIRMSADFEDAHGLADRLNAVLSGQEASNALLAIALLLASCPMTGTARTVTYGAVVLLADTYAEDPQATQH